MKGLIQAMAYGWLQNNVMPEVIKNIQENIDKPEPIVIIVEEVRKR